MGLKEMDSCLSCEFIRRIPIYPVCKKLRELNRGGLLNENQLRSIVYRLTFRGCFCEDEEGRFCFPCNADKVEMYELAVQGKLYEGEIRRE